MLNMSHGLNVTLRLRKHIALQYYRTVNWESGEVSLFSALGQRKCGYVSYWSKIEGLNCIALSVSELNSAVSNDKGWNT